MRLRIVSLIARKEFKDILRDRRTLVFMMLLPVAFMPLLMIGVTNFVKAQIKEKEAKVLVVASDPLTENMLKGLAKRWSQANVLPLMQAGVALGTQDFDPGDAQGLKKLTDRLAAIREAGAKAGDGVSEAGLVAYYRAFQELTDDQKQLLLDAQAVSQLTMGTNFVSIDKIQRSGSLAQGVSIPDGLPGRLGDPSITLALQDKVIAGAAFLDPEAFDGLDDPIRTVPVTVLYDSSISLSKEFFERFEAFIVALTRHEIHVRLTGRNLQAGFVKPFDMQEANVATESRQIQAVIGGFLPYLIILFSFMGALYPALDITAGEKERGTLETLLLAPASRMEIAVGKFIVVFVAAILAAVLTTTSMALTFNFGILPEDALKTLDITFEPLAVALTATLLVPVAALFAALLLAVGIYARSYKEAQSYAAPLNFVVVIPAMVALLPDLEMSLKLAWIPLVNMSLLTKELLKGNYLWDFYGITLLSTVLLTSLMLWITSRMFRRESVLLRS